MFDFGIVDIDKSQSLLGYPPWYGIEFQCHCVAIIRSEYDNLLTIVFACGESHV